MALRLNGSTSGYVELNAPAVAGSQSITVPYGILQVKQTYKTDVFSTSSTGTTDITGLSVSITPSSSSNKILVMAFVGGFSHNGSGAAPVIIRGSTSIGQATGASNRMASSFSGDLYTGDGSGTGQMQFNSVACYLDSPSTTSATTYKIAVQNSGNQIYINRGEADGDNNDENRGVSHITVMEVVA